MNFQPSKLVVLFLVSSCSIAMNKQKSEFNLGALKLRIHHHGKSNELQENWLLVSTSLDTKFVALKEQVAKLLQRQTHDFMLAHVDLHHVKPYDQNSQKTLHELGITDKTSLWVCSKVSASKK